MGAVRRTDRCYSIDTNNRVSECFSRYAKNAALLLVSVEYDRCLRRTASHGQDARATIQPTPSHGLQTRATLQEKRLWKYDYFFISARRARKSFSLSAVISSTPVSTMGFLGSAD